MQMYEIKEVILKNANHEKKRHVIEFYDKQMDIIGEFIMTDVSLLKNKLVDEITAVLEGETAVIVGSGNRTAWYITPETAVIEDLFVEMDGLDSSEINTKRLLEIIQDWLANKQRFEADNEE